ncbi:hypothetical protein [Vibrio parahaemolyticus]|uniref:hypothetical protein n=1 Tax=Vibrio parahaemolyticus TaxID=670 RepID=UPI001E31CAED|nr:hypothetical protein [Vibrio parahaemolyticus]HCE2124833.1 hypothetical protein [Vibrio parahaemolyticus]
MSDKKQYVKPKHNDDIEAETSQQADITLVKPNGCGCGGGNTYILKSSSDMIGPQPNGCGCGGGHTFIVDSNNEDGGKQRELELKELGRMHPNGCGCGGGNTFIIKAKK